MRATLFIALLSLTAGAASAAVSKANKTCLVCHTAPLYDVEALTKSIHAKLDCADCHKGFDYSMHRAKPPDWSDAEKALIEKYRPRSTAPEALAACGRCHGSVVDDLGGSVHGKWLKEARPAQGPLCMDCHGPVHAIAPTRGVERKNIFAERCAACHDNPEMVKKAGIANYPVESYRDSVHGRMLALGNERAPVCSNCHSYHDVAPVASDASLVSKSNKVSTCAECHKGANENFAATFTHVPLSKVTRPVPAYTVILFSWLTSLVLTGLVLHVGFDFGAEVRAWLRRRREGIVKRVHARREASVVRFDLHQRIQHWLLIVTVLTLVATDWPLRGAGIGTSRAMVGFFGGVHTAGLIHRTAGIVMGLASLYHLVYLTVLALKRKPFLSMLPMPRDITDLFGNLAYFFGARKDRPKFERYMYAEKFDYWAVFWGVAIMFGTGLVRWFPVFWSKILPASFIEAAQIAHGDEATLAALALFVWHLYNVHLRPSVFPMSWVWVDGRIDLETLKHEHPAEYERLEKEGKLP